MMTTSIEEVCDFLQQRNVSADVIKQFRDNKIDKNAATKLTDEQLKSMGLIAIGDIVMLKSFSQSPQKSSVLSPLETMNRTSRRHARGRRSQILKRMLEEASNELGSLVEDEGVDVAPKTSNRRGRPRGSKKVVSVGLRILDTINANKFSQLPSPIGDKQSIDLYVDYDIIYEHLLDELKDKFFPGGESPVLGDVNKYRLEVVNVANSNIKRCIQNQFTLWNYLVEKKCTAGKARLHLLCSKKIPVSQDTVHTQSANTRTAGETLMDVHPSTSIPPRQVSREILNSSSRNDNTSQIQIPIHANATAGTSAETLMDYHSSTSIPPRQVSREMLNSSSRHDNTSQIQIPIHANDNQSVMLPSRTSATVPPIVQQEEAVFDVHSPLPHGISRMSQYIDVTPSGEVQFLENVGLGLPLDALHGESSSNGNLVTATSDPSPSWDPYSSLFMPSSSSHPTDSSFEEDLEEFILETESNSDKSDNTSSMTARADLKVQTKRDVELAFSNLHASLTDDVEVLTVHREVLLEEMLTKYHYAGPEAKIVDVKFIGEDGEDMGGLTKDLFTNFWMQAIAKYFKGESAVVPHVALHQLHKLKQHFVPLGRLLSHTAALCSFLPSRLSRSVLLAIVFGSEGVSDEIALNDFELFVAHQERLLMHKARKNFDSLTDKQVDDLVSFYSLFGFLEQPKSSEIEVQLSAMARSEMVDKPAALVALMRKGIPSAHMDLFWSHLTVASIEHMFESQRSTIDRVIAILKPQEDALKPEEENALYLLKQYIKSLDQDDIDAFLLFVTGSTVMPSKITVAFNKLQGLLRRPISHTCSNTLDLPVTYASSQDIKREFRAVLSNSECFRMSAT